MTFQEGFLERINARASNLLIKSLIYSDLGYDLGGILNGKKN